MKFRSLRMTQSLRVALVALVLCYFGFILLYSQGVYAQGVLESKIAELERRATMMDSEHLTERIARLEALSETNNRLLLGILAAVAVMAVERIIGLGKQRTKSEEV